MGKPVHVLVVAARRSAHAVACAGAWWKQGAVGCWGKSSAEARAGSGGRGAPREAGGSLLDALLFRHWHVACQPLWEVLEWLWCRLC